jgi:hypothetical protein
MNPLFFLNLFVAPDDLRQQIRRTKKKHSFVASSNKKGPTCKAAPIYISLLVLPMIFNQNASDFVNSLKPKSSVEIAKRIRFPLFRVVYLGLSDQRHIQHR